MAKDKGWDFLNSDDINEMFNSNGESGYGYKNEDGSSSYYGNDGSWGYKNEDGSGSYYGADGSWGYKNEDGSDSYYGADGSWGYKNEDGSGSYYGADGSWEYKNEDGSGSYYGTDGSTSFSGLKDSCDETMDKSSSSVGDDDSSELAAGLIEVAIALGTAVITKHVTEPRKQGQYEQSYKDHPKSKRRNRIFKLIMLFIIFVVTIIAFGYYESTILIPVSYSTDSLVGTRYPKVVDKLKNTGFTNIITKEINDLSANYISDEYEVTNIKIGWISSFSDTTKFPSNFPVTITYHSAQKIAVPMSSKESKGLNYKEVKKAFKDSGFINVKSKIEYDIITGWLKHDGEVESVVVNGDKKYDSGDEYKLNSDVIITYHTYRTNKPD